MPIAMGLGYYPFGCRWLLIMYAISRCCVWVVEQPANSIMNFHPVFHMIRHLCATFTCFTWMGAFGGVSPKPTRLWSNCESLLASLVRPLPKKQWHPEDPNYVCKKYVDRNGKKRVAGGRGLKSTQAYPDEFGQELAQAFTQIDYWKEFNGDEFSHRDFFDSHPNFWQIAQLESVFQAIPAISLD